MYETLYNQIVTYEAELATVGMIDVYENRESRLTDKKEIKILSQNEAIQAVLDSTDVYAYAVNKLYKKELFNKVR
ncbi:UNVERIFIED_CONTAM: glycosyltransferase family 2 protein, partial [Pseudomonas aeruginosa]